MHAPSLRWRLTAVTLAVVGILVAALDAFIYLSLRDQLEEQLVAVLEARAAIALELSQTADPVGVAQRLTELGVPAVVQPAAGEEIQADPQARRFSQVPPGTGERLEQLQMSRRVPLDDGGSITVLVSRGGVESTLERVRLLEIIGSVAALALATVLLWVVTGRLLRPVDDVVGLARGIARGRSGGRLRPNRTDTELGRMAGAFDEMLDSLEAALGDARASETASRRFLADAAHQLRTPVAGVRASAEVLLRDPETPARDELLGNLARESARAGRLIRSLLRVTELDRDLAPEPRPADVRRIVREEVERHRNRAPHLEFRCSVDDDVPGDMPLVVDDVREALGNVLENASRHAERSVETDVTVGDAHVSIRVSDDGPGLPPEDVDRAFERFVSLDGRGGTGLGLSIARDLCRRLGGDVRYRNGAFTVLVPRSDRDSRAGEPVGGG